MTEKRDEYVQTGNGISKVGDIKIECMRVPGHTWGHMVHIGSYSLCFPYYIAGKGRYAILLERRNTSNTCLNLLQRGKCALNFNTDDRAYFKEAVRFGFPGPSKEKMKDNLFTMEDGQADPTDKTRRRSLRSRSRRPRKRILNPSAMPPAAAMIP